MSSIQDLANRLAIYLAAYKHYIELKSKAGLLDVTKFGEALARDIAEIVFDYKDLVNLNLESNFTAIDLGSLTAGCAIQVTLSASTTKVVETLNKFFEHGLDGTYSALKFIALRDKQKTYVNQQITRSRGTFDFDPDRDIYDLGDLFKILVAQANSAKLEAACKRLEAEIGSEIRPYLLDADRLGQRLRNLFSAHDVRTTDGVKALQSFGVSRTIYSDSLSLAEASSREMIEYVAEQFWISSDWIEGTYDHIYSDAPGAEKTTDWRRSLRGAYDLIERASADGEQLNVMIPVWPDFRELDAIDDVVDFEALDYKHFFLVARKSNDFSVDCFRLAISDPLSYRKCRDGLFLLFLAAEIYEIETQRKTYIDVYQVQGEHIRSCCFGDMFLVDVVCAGRLVRNHKDFIYSDGTAMLKATRDVPSRLAIWLQENLTEFVARRSSLLPTTITFP
ncbi:SMEK domain-containing protein [Paraburkholderia dinghuensis]|uniref:SMEK domain-containing protein n=1 Tax=Paraburkholderia dinghuensis TaxID=2305225 RepID=A0A3N6M9Z1_9BURK|nr:SMEK domain-containing protein [Paraburkholderia dinghuensis]RQG99267.1 hypothetical protein D1Y85_26620 [Paraburkholderia dinghuensis]